MSDRKLKAWQAAGLIDSATAARIAAWEAENSRPLALWAVIGIAALAIGLGLISVVAANWDAIPGIVRLGLHFVIIAGILAFMWLRGEDLAVRQPWFHEAALFIAGALGLTFLGHVGQVYQTTSPLWQPIGLWLVLFAPLLLSQGRSWLTAAMVQMSLVAAVWLFAQSFDHHHPGLSDTQAMVQSALATGSPILVTGFAAWMRGRSERADFWRRLEQLALIYAVGGVTGLTIIAAFERWGRGSDPNGLVFSALCILAAMTLVTSLWVWRARLTGFGQATAGVLAAAAATGLLAYGISGGETAAGIVFMLFWVCVAAACLFGGWRGVFQAAIAILALRLIILSFELAGDLLTSGAGLILSGLLILGITWAAVRVSKRFAPAKGVGA